MVSSHIKIASEPSGKKCGPKLLPMMSEKTNPVNARLLTAIVAAECSMKNKPRIVIGQLFMIFAPIVTIKLGARMLRKEGNVVVAKNVEAKISNYSCVC
jgi:hypothetical protein